LGGSTARVETIIDRAVWFLNLDEHGIASNMDGGHFFSLMWNALYLKVAINRNVQYE
jgi:hypothetical protein